jgi:hypothetical protein
VGPVVIVVVLPLPQLLVKEMDVVADTVVVEELVELLVIDSVRALDLPVEPRRVRADVDVADSPFFEMPMELGLELGAVVRLHDEHAERQAVQDFVDERDRRALGAGVVHLEHVNPRAIVDGGELIEPPSRAGDALEEFHIELQSVSRLRFLVALPTLPMRLMLWFAGRRCIPCRLRIRCAEERAIAMPWNRFKLRGDPTGAKVIVLAEIEDLADHLQRGGSRGGAEFLDAHGSNETITDRFGEDPIRRRLQRQCFQEEPNSSMKRLSTVNSDPLVLPLLVRRRASAPLNQTGGRVREPVATSCWEPRWADSVSLLFALHFGDHQSPRTG